MDVKNVTLNNDLRIESPAEDRTVKQFSHNASVLNIFFPKSRTFSTVNIVYVLYGTDGKVKGEYMANVNTDYTSDDYYNVVFPIPQPMVYDYGTLKVQLVLEGIASNGNIVSQLYSEQIILEITESSVLSGNAIEDTDIAATLQEGITACETRLTAIESAELNAVDLTDTSMALPSSGYNDYSISNSSLVSAAANALLNVNAFVLYIKDTSSTVFNPTIFRILMAETDRNKAYGSLVIGSNVYAVTLTVSSTISVRLALTTALIPDTVIKGNTSYGGTLTDDLNSLSKNGFYTCFGTATGAPNTDYSWHVTHQNSNTGTVYATQRAVAFSPSLIVYERTKTGSAWNAWTNLDDRYALSGTNGNAKIISDHQQYTTPSADVYYTFPLSSASSKFNLHIVVRVTSALNDDALNIAGVQGEVAIGVGTAFIDISWDGTTVMNIINTEYGVDYQYGDSRPDGLGFSARVSMLDLTFDITVMGVEC